MKDTIRDSDKADVGFPRAAAEGFELRALASYQTRATS